MNPYTAYFENLGRAARSASVAGQVLSTDDKNRILEQIAYDLENAIPMILEANTIDCSQAKENGNTCDKSDQYDYRPFTDYPVVLLLFRNPHNAPHETLTYNYLYSIAFTLQFQ